MYFWRKPQKYFSRKPQFDGVRMRRVDSASHVTVDTLCSRSHRCYEQPYTLASTCLPRNLMILVLYSDIFMCLSSS
jgi:hypothetical protein